MLLTLGPFDDGLLCRAFVVADVVGQAVGGVDLEFWIFLFDLLCCHLFTAVIIAICDELLELDFVGIDRSLPAVAEACWVVGIAFLPVLVRDFCKPRKH